MEKAFLTLARAHLQESIDTLIAAQKSDSFIGSMCTMTTALVKVLGNGGKLLIAGNGGSAGDAQHIAGEFLSRLNFDRAPLAAVALTTDSSVLTAIGNDYGYERVFERQVLGLGNARDAFLAISTSGRSPNIIRALEAARSKNMLTLGFCGEDARDMGPLCDISLRVPSQNTPLIQQLHIIAAHIICGGVEAEIFGNDQNI